jgi:hypothetical protein
MLHSQSCALAELHTKCHHDAKTESELDTPPWRKILPFCLSLAGSASDQNQKRVDLESASNMSNREKVNIKGTVPDQFLSKQKHQTLVPPFHHHAVVTPPEVNQHHG